jgi:hypothetical protein
MTTGTGGHLGAVLSSAGVVTGANTTLFIGSLTPGGLYGIQAGAWDLSAQASTQSVTVTGSTATVPVAPPIGGFQIFSTSATFALTMSANAAGTYAVISTGTSGHYGVALSSMGVYSGVGTTVTLTLAGLTPNTTYSYQQGAFANFAGASTQTNTSTFDTRAAAPVVTDFQVFSTSISVTLGNNGNPVGTPLAVSTGTNGDFRVSSVTVGTVTGANTTLTLSGLFPGKVYGIQSGAWGSTAANGSTQTTIVATATGTVAVAPLVISFDVYATSGALVILGQGNADGTRIVASTGTSGIYDAALSSAGVLSSGTVRLQFPGVLTPNTSYGYQVGAFADIAGASTQSSTGFFTTSPLAPTVSGLQIFTTSAAIVLGSNGNPAGTTALAVSTGTDGNFAVSLSSIGALAGTNTAFVLQGLTPNTLYGFQGGSWRSVSSGASTQSVTVTASTTTAAAVPGAGSFLQVSASSATFSWGSNGNPLTPPTSYQAEISTSSDFVPSASSVTFLTQAGFVSLNPATTYYARAAAFNRFGAMTAYNSAVSTSTL